MSADIDDALSRLGCGRSILFNKDSPCFAELSHRLSVSDRCTVVLWGLQCAESVVEELSRRHPDDPRPMAALELSRGWSRGAVSMREAKRAILDVHAMAVGLPDSDAALCHAVGQGCSCVHTPKHALGLPIYDLSAMVMDGFREREVTFRVEWYMEVLDGCSGMDKSVMDWARFLRERFCS